MDSVEYGSIWVDWMFDRYVQGRSMEAIARKQSDSPMWTEALMLRDPIAKVQC